MLLYDLSSIFPESFCDLIDQLGILACRGNQVHRTHVESCVIFVQSFVGTTGNNRFMEKCIFFNERLSGCFIKGNVVHIKSACCLSD